MNALAYNLLVSVLKFKTSGGGKYELNISRKLPDVIVAMFDSFPIAKWCYKLLLILASIVNLAIYSEKEINA